MPRRTDIHRLSAPRPPSAGVLPPTLGRAAGRRITLGISAPAPYVPNPRAYTLGGVTTGFAGTTAIDRFSGASETNALLAIASRAVASGHAGCGLAARLHGYICGGSTTAGGTLTDVDRLRFGILETISHQYRALPAATLGIQVAGATNVTSKGLIVGGGQGAFGGTSVNSLYRLTYAEEAFATSGATLSQVLQHATVGCSPWSLYSMGGSAAATDRIERVTFQDEIRTQLSATLSTTNRFAGAGLSGPNATYMAGGTSMSAVVDRLDFATETRAAIAVLPTGTQSCGEGSFNGNGYMIGGLETGSVVSGAYKRFPWLTETFSVISATCTPKVDCASVCNSGAR